MRNWIALSIAFSLALSAGCTSIPVRDNPWTDLAVDTAPAARPVSPPELPVGTVEGQRLYFTPAEADTLTDFVDVADGNYEIATELAESVDSMRGAYNDLVRAGNAEHELAELLRRMLEEERRARLWDKLSSWSIIGFLGIISVVD